jgi:hypothetical protein
LLVVNNEWGKAKDTELQGTNEFYEFSGYDQLLQWMKEREGPFVIVNDTFFKTHQTRLWLWLLKRVLTQSHLLTSGVVYGDIRRDGDALTERPNPFWASWIFVIPDVATLKRFQEILELVTTRNVPTLSEAYTEFLDDWLQPKQRWGGWHGQVSEQALERKRACIIMEHQLSKLWLNRGYEIGSVGDFYPHVYRMLRILDRLKTRWHAWVG